MCGAYEAPTWTHCDCTFMRSDGVGTLVSLRMANQTGELPDTG